MVAEGYTRCANQVKDHPMNRILAIGLSLCLLFCATVVSGQTSPIVAPDTGILLAQIDDSDLQDEEDLARLMAIEYDKKAMSMGKAVSSSFIPGGGWGLMYTGNKYAASVPFALFAIGVGVGTTYVSGLLDTEAVPICQHIRDGRVNSAECEYQNTVRSPDTLMDSSLKDRQDEDPRSEGGTQRYYQTGGDYSKVTAGKNFNGLKTGTYIIVGTYLLTTIVGAVWAGLNVKEHNDQIRRDIESTVERRSPRHRQDFEAKPLLGYTGDRGVVGFSLSF